MTLTAKSSKILMCKPLDWDSFFRGGGPKVNVTTTFNNFSKNSLDKLPNCFSILLTTLPVFNVQRSLHKTFQNCICLVT